MTGTARCGVCGVVATHEAGPGTPLSIRHDPGCAYQLERRDEHIASLLRRTLMGGQSIDVARAYATSEGWRTRRWTEADVDRAVLDIGMPRWWPGRKCWVEVVADGCPTSSPGSMACRWRDHVPTSVYRLERDGSRSYSQTECAPGDELKDRP